jgi:hypothetical protein
LGRCWPRRSVQRRDRQSGNQGLKLYGLFAISNGYGGMGIKSLALCRRDFIEEAAALDDVKTNAFFRRKYTQDNVIGCDHVSQCTGLI